MRSPQIRIMLVDDHALMRAGMRAIIESRPFLSVVGEAENNPTVLTQSTAKQSDIILLDGDDRHGLEIVPDLLVAADPARLIILSSAHQNDLHVEAMQLGARGVFLKDQSPPLLVKAIQKVHQGESWFSRAMMAHALQRLQHPHKQSSPEEANISTLTDRELDVIRLLGEGLKNRDIGEQLHISESTVRHHFTSIYGKLGVADRLELLIYSYRHNLIQQPC